MTGEMLARLLDPRALSARETRSVFHRLLGRDTTEVERAGLLVALAARPLSVPELAAFATEMRRRAVPFEIPAGDRPVDLCGSGGAPTPSFNVSTVSAFVVAAAGVPVVKHGNRSATGICGSSDLLEALGLPVTTSAPFARATYRAHRLAFLHAPLYHPATRAVAGARKALGIPTLFNRLGPLCNPASVAYQVAGAPDTERAASCAAVLSRLGVRAGLSMASRDGCDEFSPRAETVVFGWSGRSVQRRTVRPDGLLHPSERKGGWAALPPDRAAAATESLLAGRLGARRGSVLLTSGAAFSVTGTAASLASGVALARRTIDSGAAAQLLSELRSLAGDFRGRDP